MVGINKLSVHHAGTYLFDEISFMVQPRDRIGLVGKNGAGKTTLLKILAGMNAADEGTISFPKEYSIGYLSQELSFNGNRSVMEEAEEAFKEIKKLQQHYDELTLKVSEESNHQSKEYLVLLDQWHEVSHRLELLGLASLQEQLEKILTGLGFERNDFSRSVSEFSGGWQMRVELAKLLLQKPDLLLLDEPTNHLDIEAIIWLENFLSSYEGAIILVSHDRAFLDRVTNRTIEIVNGRIEDYPCSYSKYIILREERREHIANQKKNQDRQIRHTEDLIEKFRYKANKAKFAQSLIKQLARTERIEIPDEDSSSIRFRFPDAPRSGLVVFEAKDIAKNYGSKNVFQDVSFKIERGDRVAFVGRNGEGKTTMAKILVGEESGEGLAHIGHNVKTGFYAQHQADRLAGNKTVFETIDSIAPHEMHTRVRGLLGAFLFSGDDIYKKVSVLSGGEKSRLALVKLLLEPYNLLVLDEPTNHLDMRSKDILKEALLAYNGTLVIVSHDRDFLNGLVSKIFYFRQHHIKEYLGGVYEFLQSQQSATFRELELKKEMNDKKAGPIENLHQHNRQQQKEKNKLEKQLQKYREKNFRTRASNRSH